MLKWLSTAATSLRKALYPSWLKDMVTEADGETVDAKRVMGLGGCTSFFYLSFHSVVINHAPFDAQNYGIGLGAILVSVGGMLSLGRSSEATPE